jgi:hypothetical protein
MVKELGSFRKGAAAPYPDKNSRDQFLSLLDGGERVGSDAAVRLLRGLHWPALSNNFPSLGGGLAEDQDLHLQFFHQGHHSMQYHRLSNFVPFLFFSCLFTLGFKIGYFLIILSHFFWFFGIHGSFTKKYPSKATYPEEDLIVIREPFISKETL